MVTAGPALWPLGRNCYVCGNAAGCLVSNAGVADSEILRPVDPGTTAADSVRIENRRKRRDERTVANETRTPRVNAAFLEGRSDRGSSSLSLLIFAELALGFATSAGVRRRMDAVSRSERPGPIRTDRPSHPLERRQRRRLESARRRAGLVLARASTAIASGSPRRPAKATRSAALCLEFNTGKIDWDVEVFAPGQPGPRECQELARIAQPGGRATAAFTSTTARWGRPAWRPTRAKSCGETQTSSSITRRARAARRSSSRTCSS